MPGFELVGQEEFEGLKDIFERSGGVLFAHGWDARRNGIFRVRDFEKAAATRFGARHCTAVSSGTAALFVALKALGIKPGDEVITQAFTFVATVEAILECGAVPVVVEVDASLNMDPKALEAAITDKTRAIIPVHMLGNPARMAEIQAIAGPRKIPLLEDACEAIGATYRGKHLGCVGEIGVFSLDFGKAMTSGEGGLIFTDDARLHQFTSAYHDHGHDNDPGLPRGRDTAHTSGFNFRMSEMQAAVGLVQLKKLDRVLEANRRNKAAMKAVVAGQLGGRIEFRDIVDEGELADTLMFFLPTEKAAQKAVADFAAAGIGLKNVPDAMRWHFAGFWGHIWKDQPRYAGNFENAWSKSRDFLNRCISLPVMVLNSEEKSRELADKAAAIVQRHL